MINQIHYDLDPLVYIKGVTGKGKEVLAELRRRTNRIQSFSIDGEDPSCLYYIDPFGIIKCVTVHDLTPKEYDCFIKNYTEIILPTHKSILNKKEKEYLEGVIGPWREEVVSIKKISCDLQAKSCIQILCRHDCDICLPYFKDNEHMYEGMKSFKEYFLEELGL